MKQLIRIVIFVSIILVSLAGLDRLYTFALQHNQNLKLTSVVSSPRNAALLIHGPCEPLWIVSPQLIDRYTGVASYNLALSHSDFADNYLHLYLYLKSNKPPAYMLLYVTPESFDVRYNVFNAFRFAPYLQDPVVKEVVRENDPGYYRWAAIPFIRYAYYGKRVTFQAVQGLKHYHTGRQRAYYHDGFEPPARRVWANHHENFVSLYEDSVYFHRDSLREKYLVKTVELAKSKGIKVILYESPVLSAAVRDQKNRQEMIRYIRSMARDLGAGYIQFTGMEMSENRKYFNSALTLTLDGVRLFNDTLGKFLHDHCSFRGREQAR